MANELDFSGKQMLVVGGSSGIGNGIAQASTLDIASRADIDRGVNDVASHFGGLDIVANNAGISVRTAIDDEDYDDAWTKAMAVMLTAQPRVIRAALPFLRRSKSPRIVNIASTEALGATALHSPYSAAKAGVVGLGYGSGTSRTFSRRTLASSAPRCRTCANRNILASSISPRPRRSARLHSTARTRRRRPASPA